MQVLTEEGPLVSSTIRDAAVRRNLPLTQSLLAQDGPGKRGDSTQMRELFAARERAQEPLNSIGDAVLSTDPAGKVNYLNPVAERMTGWSQADAVGRPLQEVFATINDSVRESLLTEPPAVGVQDSAGHCISSTSQLCSRRVVLGFGWFQAGQRHVRPSGRRPPLAVCCARIRTIRA